MKLKKNGSRIAAALVATTMLAAMAAPVYAADGETGTEPPAYGGVGEDGTQYEDGNAIQNLTFKKVLQLPENVPVPDVDFTFTLSGTEAEEGEQVRGLRNGGSTAVDVVSGTGTATGTAVFGTDSATTATDKEGVVQTETVVNIPLDALEFDNVGAYKYILHESDVAETVAANEEYTVAEDRVVYLYVERVNADTPEEDYVVSGIVMMDPDGEYNTSNPNDGAKSDGTIVNTYLLDENGDPKDNELIVSKKVDGAMANRNDEFEFTVTINYQYTGDDRNNENNTAKSYKAVFEIWDEEQQQYVVNDKRDAVVFTAEPVTPKYPWNWNAVLTTTLKHNERIHIYGLTNGQQCDIVESQAAGHGAGGKYTPSWVSSSGNSGKKNNCTEHFMGTNVTVDYTNFRDAVSPTGLVMDIAPYVLLVVAAAAGCFIFMRKRRED